MNEPEVRLLAGNHGNPVLVTLLRFRNHCHTIIVQHIPEPQASVAGGMLLGLKAAIPDDIYTVFSANGITHVLVISGWHLGMVASVISGTARRLRANRAAIFWGSLAVLWLYVLFVGATATVLRAGVMASLVVLADVTERQTEPWTLLLAACWFLTLLNPHILWDLGFQLSALATASLFAFHTPLKQWVEAWWVVRQAPLSLAWFTDPLSVTLAAQILALPIILFHFGNLSIISPLSNVVLVPVVPYVMMLGALALGVSLVAGFIGWLAQVIWMVAWLPLAYLTEGARLLAAVPWAAVQLPPFPLWLLSGYYGTVACWWLWGQWATHREHPEPE
jgi:competence protein ComEC